MFWYFHQVFNSKSIHKLDSSNPNCNQNLGHLTAEISNIVQLFKLKITISKLLP